MSLSSFGIAVKKSFDFEEASTKASDRELTSESEVSDFISAAKLPLFIPFSQSNADLIFESGLEGQIMFIGDTDSLDGETFAPFKKARMTPPMKCIV